jgi:hypothetical protein
MSGLLTLGAGRPRPASGGGVFDPATVSGLTMWLKADALVGLADGDPVSTWTDSSGNGNSATGITTARPTYKTNIIGSLPVLRFATSKMTTSYAPPVTDFSIFIVYKDSGAATAFERLIDKSFSQGFWMGRANTGSNSWGGGIKQTGSPFGTYVTATDPGPNVLTMIRSGTAQQVRANGGASVASGTVNGTATDSTAFTIGSVADDSSKLSGDIAEIVFYTNAVSNTDRDSIETYLKSKYGIA